MDIKKFGCRKSFEKPKMLWLLEWESANKTEVMRSRRNEGWQSVGIISGNVEGKNPKMGRLAPYAAHTQQLSLSIRYHTEGCEQLSSLDRGSFKRSKMGWRA